MRIFICLILMTMVCTAEVKLYRYTDKITGDERGICYSGRDGTPAIVNLDWDMEVIPESQKEFYMNLRDVQIQAEMDIIKQKKIVIKDKIKTKVGLTDEELDILMGNTD